MKREISNTHNKERNIKSSDDITKQASINKSFCTAVMYKLAMYINITYLETNFTICLLTVSPVNSKACTVKCC